MRVTVGRFVLLPMVLITLGLVSTAAADTNTVDVQYGIGDHGRRIHILVNYSIAPPRGCPDGDSWDPAISKRYWSVRCKAYRQQRAGIVLRIYRVSKPDGLALVKKGRAHAQKYPSDEIHGGSWATDVYTTQFRTGCFRGKYVIMATIIDPYRRPNVSGYAQFVCH